jgi:DNA-binding transcriptional ArsR family regulator
MLFRFSPSLMPADALEGIFVQREAIANRVVSLIHESAVTETKHHTLLIGPRGTGKTHFVSLVYHRLRRIPELSDRLLIAWLREEEWGVTSFLDLLVRIMTSLATEYGDATLTNQLNALYQLPARDAEIAAIDMLKQHVGNRTLLLQVENLDEIFLALGVEGQQQLRALLQETQFCTVLATSQRLFNGVSLRTSPFYGFFRITHLEDLTVDEAGQLLKNIARYQGDHALASFIDTSIGKARIRAVHHLTRGNHRIYAIFSQFLTRSSLDQLVEPFMRTLDDLTPYYQARMMWLSAQQRKIVEILTMARGSLPVKEIAARGFMTHQTTSSQLKDLRDKGYVVSTVAGREAFYEIREPLMRMCFEMRQHRGDALRPFIELLRLWYTRSELRDRLRDPPADADATKEREYILAALDETDRADAQVAVAEAPSLDSIARRAFARSSAPSDDTWSLLLGEISKMTRLTAVRYRLDADDLQQDVVEHLLSWRFSHDVDEVQTFPSFIYFTVLSCARVMRGRRVAEGDSTETDFDWRTIDAWALDIPDPGVSNDFEEAERRIDHRATVWDIVSERGSQYLQRAILDRRQSSRRLRDLVRRLEYHGGLDLLAPILFGVMSRILNATETKEEAHIGLQNLDAAVQRALRSRDDLSFVRDLTQVAVRYLQTGDRRVLFDVPIEMRSLFESILDSSAA